MSHWIPPRRTRRPYIEWVLIAVIAIAVGGYLLGVGNTVLELIHTVIRILAR